MHLKNVVVLIVMVLGVSALPGVPTASASVPVSQTAAIRQERPVAGRYNERYKNYGERVCVVRSCVTKWYRVSRGVVSTKVRTYRVRDENDRFEYFLLTVDSAVRRKRGSSDEGLARIRINTDGTVVDSEDSKSINADEQECSSYPVSVGLGFGPVAGGIDVGAVEFCDEAASFTRSYPGAGAVSFAADRLPQIRSLTAARLVKVRQGRTPSFTVQVSVPRDDCTATGPEGSSYDDYCTEFDSSARTFTYRIGSGDGST